MKLYSKIRSCIWANLLGMDHFREIKTQTIHLHIMDYGDQIILRFGSSMILDYNDIFIWIIKYYLKKLNGAIV